MFPRYSLVRALTVCAVLSVLSAQLSFAQGSGTIRGKAFDKATGEALPGANVVVKGTTLGASTNLDGDFVLHNVRAGERAIVVSYLGYLALDLVVSVPSGGTVTQDFGLTAAAIETEAIIVTVQAKGQLQAINQQIASDKIANIVSEAKIQELPDFNAAQAISRLPGVATLQSSGEANKVVIRGLAPQFNIVSVSNIPLSATGNSRQIGITSLAGGEISSDRSVDLSMVTPYMIKSIAVYKTLTPDLDANAIGGYVNMELREAPSGPHADVLWQSGYTKKTKEYGNYRTVISGSDRFFDDILGIYVLGNAEQYDRASDNMTGSYDVLDNRINPLTGYRPVKVTNVTLSRHIETRKRYGANATFDVALPTGSIRFINMFSRLDSRATDYQTILHYGDGTSGNIDFNYRRPDSKTDLAINILEAENDFDFMSATLKLANSYSRNHLPGSPYYQFRQTSGIPLGGVDLRDQVPEALAPHVTYKGPRETYLNTITLFGADYKANDQVVKADLKFPQSLGSSVSGYLKLGGEFRYNHRANDQSTPYLDVRRAAPFGGGDAIANYIIDSIRANFVLTYDSSAARFPASNFTATDQDLYASFLKDRFSGILWVNDPSIINSILDYTLSDPRFNARETGATTPGGWYDGGFQNLPNDYTYIERYYAAYAMAEINLGPDIRIVGGARYEAVKSLFEAFNLTDGRNPLSQNVFPVTVYPDNHNWLPMVQAKYNIFDWLDVRYAYTQTLARPDYHQLSPHISMTNDRNFVYAGNPNLKPARSYNHDLQFTLHNNEIGLITLGAFYKTVSQFTYASSYMLHNPIDPVTTIRYTIPEGLDSASVYRIGGTIPNNGATLNTFLNSPYDALVKGVEADVQLRFWYLPAPFNGMVVGLNYTHVWSHATYPYRYDRQPIVDPITRLRSVTVIDSSRPGRLIYQPDDVVNGYLGYDYEGFSVRLSVVFQGNSVSRIGSYIEQDGFTRDYFRVDASARQLLPFAGLQLFLDVNNLNERNNQSAQKSIGGFTDEQNYGLTANLGIRFSL